MCEGEEAEAGWESGGLEVSGGDGFPEHQSPGPLLCWPHHRGNHKQKADSSFCAGQRADLIKRPLSC